VPAPASAASTCAGAEIEIDSANPVGLERTLLCLTNVFRAENALPALTMDANLRTGAHEHSERLLITDQCAAGHSASAAAEARVDRLEAKVKKAKSKKRKRKLRKKLNAARAELTTAQSACSPATY
jgi:uncharacterized protein YkwD